MKKYRMLVCMMRVVHNKGFDLIDIQVIIGVVYIHI